MSAEQHTRTVRIGDTPPFVEVVYALRHEARVRRLSPMILAARRGMLSRPFCLAEAERLAAEARSVYAKCERHVRLARGDHAAHHDSIIRKLEPRAEDSKIQATLWAVAAELAPVGAVEFDERKVKKSLGSARAGLGVADLRGLRERALAA